jgi:hypothetical protein
MSSIVSKHDGDVVMSQQPMAGHCSDGRFTVEVSRYSSRIGFVKLTSLIAYDVELLCATMETTIREWFGQPMALPNSRNESATLRFVVEICESYSSATTADLEFMAKQIHDSAVAGSVLDACGWVDVGGRHIGIEARCDGTLLHLAVPAGVYRDTDANGYRVASRAIRLLVPPGWCLDGRPLRTGSASNPELLLTLIGGAGCRIDDVCKYYDDLCELLGPVTE